MRTDAPFGSPSSFIGPLYPDSAAKPSAVIAWTIAALPATAPISESRSRRLGALADSSVIFCAQLDRHELAASLAQFSPPWHFVIRSNRNRPLWHSASRPACADRYRADPLSAPPMPAAPRSAHDRA